MRVCLVSKEIAPFYGAGIGTYIAHAARAWAAAGHETHVLTHPHPAVADAANLFPGVTFHTIRLESGREQPFVRDSRAVLLELDSLHAAHAFDAIEFPDYLAEGFEAIRARHTSGAIRGAVLVVRLHTPTRTCRLLNGEPVDGRDAFDALDRREYAAIAAADLLLSPSTSLLDIVTKRLKALGRHDERQPAGVVPYPFDPVLALKDLGLATGDSGSHKTPPAAETATILHLGRFEHRKGVDLLVVAAQRLLSEGLDFRVRMIGGDTRTGPGLNSMRRSLERLVDRRWRSRFIFESARPRTELGPILRDAALCCIPSRWDNFPNVCLEAMSAGCCVVASASGGPAEIIEPDISGVLCRPRDVEDLQSSLRRVLIDEHMRVRCARAAPSRIGQFCHPPTIIERTIAAIHQARDSAFTPAWMDPDSGRRGPMTLLGKRNKGR